MTDPRVQKLANVLVNTSIQVKPGEKIWIKVTDPAGLVLGKEVYKAVVKAGGLPYFDLGVEELGSWYMKNASEAQLNAKPELYAHHVNYFDKSIFIAAEVNTSDMVSVNPSRLKIRAKLHQPYKDINTRKPWVLTYFPTPAMAQAANMNTEELEDFYFESCNQDWTEIEAEMKRLAKALTDQPLEMIGDRTHLKMETKGRIWIYDDWKANIPGGEVFTAPVETSVEGEVYFHFPLTRQGVTMRDIHLWFEKGLVVKAEASDNQAYLEHILDTDAGSRRLGEIAIGGNPGVTKYMNNVLFDEKMKGTMHMALGFAYEDCGGVNKSAIHMDMIKDMHPKGSQLLAGGKTIIKDGAFMV